MTPNGGPFDELRSQVKAAGWELLEWADGDLSVEFDDVVWITARADNHDEAAAQLLPWLRAVSGTNSAQKGPDRAS